MMHCQCSFFKRKNCWAQILCPPCYERDQRVNMFCALFFIKQGFASKKAHPSIVIESTSLYVVTQLLVDAETKHSQTWPSSRFCPLFSSFSIRPEKTIGQSFSSKHGKYIDKRRSFDLLFNISWFLQFCINFSGIQVVALRQLHLCVYTPDSIDL